MCFFDLRIPYQESDRKVVDKTSLTSRRLKLLVKAMELGYTGVAYNHTVKGIMSESDRCSISLFPITKITPSSTFFATVKFHRELLKIPVSRPFRQYTRLTVVVDTPPQASALNSGNPILKTYDIVAVRPMNQTVFDQACQTSEVNMISIDFSEKLPFRLKLPLIKAAMKRGVFFEISYSGMLADPQSRRHLVSNCKMLVEWTSGKNLIFSSDASSAAELRGPLDVANLFSIIGISSQRAQAAISNNCRCLLANALRKKRFYKEAVRVEEIPVGVQIIPAKSLSKPSLEWDPVSSDGGDLLLDDLERSFLAFNDVEKQVKPIQVASDMNGFPANGLQIKGDVLCVTKDSADRQAIGNSPVTAIEIKEDPAFETSEKHVETSQSHIEVCENQGYINITTTTQEKVVSSEDQISSSRETTEDQKMKELLDVRNIERFSATSVQKAVEQWDSFPWTDEPAIVFLNHGGCSVSTLERGVLGVPESEVGDALASYQVEDSGQGCQIAEEVPSSLNLISMDFSDSIKVADPALFQGSNSESQVEIEIGEPKLEDAVVDSVPHDLTLETDRQIVLPSSSPCTQNLSVEMVNQINNEKPLSSASTEDPKPNSINSYKRLSKCRSVTASGNEKAVSDLANGDSKVDCVRPHSGKRKRKHHAQSPPTLFPFKRFCRHLRKFTKKCGK